MGLSQNGENGGGTINFSEFSKKVYPHLGFTKQSWYVGGLFTAAGSGKFPERPDYDTDSYQTKIYNGSKSFNKTLKASFPRPIDIAKVSAFFFRRIGDGEVLNVLAEFGLPKDTQADKTALADALARQFESIVVEVSDDAPDIVDKVYLEALSGDNVTKKLPYYEGDDCEIAFSPKQIDTVFYEICEVGVVIKNTGRVAWAGRRFVRTNETSLRTEPKSGIDIPALKPGEQDKICVKIDARGEEGERMIILEMEDDGGNICFPNKDGLKLAVRVRNDLRERAHKHGGYVNAY